MIGEKLAISGGDRDGWRIGEARWVWVMGVGLATSAAYCGRWANGVPAAPSDANALPADEAVGVALQDIVSLSGPIGRNTVSMAWWVGD